MIDLSTGLFARCSCVARSVKVTDLQAGALAICLLVVCGQSQAAPVADVGITVSDAEPFIGASVSIDVTFDNTGPAGDTGYGPFIDLVLPTRGVDGDPSASEALDGLSFVSAEYSGFPTDFFTLTFPDDDGPGGAITGCVDHPLAVDTAGDPLQVCGRAGDTLVVARLPFGSFVTDQPPAPITVVADVSNLADVGQALDLRARGGFQFGADELANPSTDPSIVSQASADSTTWSPSATVTPQIVTVEKLAPDGLTGENFPRQYDIRVTIAPGQTIDGLTIIDTLPSDVVYLGTTASQGTVTLEPLLGEVVDPVANEVRVELAGGASGTVNLAIDYFVPEADFGLTPTIPRATADGQNSDPNSVSVAGTWTTPIDSRDVGQAINEGVSNVTRQDIALELVKSINTTQALPGEIVEYTLQIRPSDYFAFDQLVIDDVLGDGHRWFTDATRVPTLELSGHQGSLPPVEIDAANVVITPDYSAFGDDATGDGNTGDGTDGATLIEFAVSDELILRGEGGQLLGGCFPAGTGGNGVADCDRSGNVQLQSPDAVSTITITFYAEVQQFYSDAFPSGNPAVVQGDSIGNTATVDVRVLEDSTLTPTGFQEASGDGAGFNIPVGVLSKTLYEINGATPPVPAVMRPGDAVTYRITYELPTHNFEQFRLIDYLPLPVFSATSVSTFQDVVDAASPPIGEAKFGPADTLRGFLQSNGLNLPINGARIPVLTSDVSGNLIQFNYGDFDTDGAVPDAPETVDILFTVEVSDRPFADGLLLTNQAQALESTTSQEASTSDAINQILLNEPELVITKGIVGSDNANSSLDPTPVGDPADSNLLDGDAGDVVSFVITLDNEGGASAFDVNVWDSAPAELIACGVTAVTIDGSPATFTGDLFDAGNPLILDNPLPDGQRAQISYDCTLSSAVSPREVINNTATANWRAAAGATVPFPDITDDATTITIADPELDKTVEAIAPGPMITNVVPGDVVTYRLLVTLPEGTTPGVTLDDVLPSGFDYIAGSVAVDTAGFGGSVTNASPTNAGSTSSPIFDLGDVTVTANNNASDDSFVVTYDVRVLDAAANDGLPVAQNKTNTATLDFTGNPGGGISDDASVDFLEPELTISKLVSPSTGLEGGDTVTVTLTVENTGTASALDISVSDVLDNAVFDTGTVGNLSTAAGYSNVSFGVTNRWDADATTALAAGDSATFSFTVDLAPGVLAGSTFTNTADVVGYSQEGPISERRETSDTGSDDLSTALPTLTKLIDSVSPQPAVGNVVPGDVVTYRLQVTLPVGTTPGAFIEDTLPAGFEYLAGTVAVDLTGFAGSVTNNPPIVSGTAQVPIFTLGDVSAADNNNPADNTFAVVFDARVLDVAANDGLPVAQTKTNTATLDFTGNPSGGISDTASIDFLEPSLTISKSVSPSTGLQGGDTVTVTLTVDNLGTAPALDVVLSDVLDSNVFDTNTVSISTTPAGYSNTSIGVTNTWESNPAVALSPGASAVFSFTVELAPAVLTGSSFTNTANVIAYSQEGVVSNRRSTANSGSDNFSTIAVALSKTLSDDSEASSADSAQSVVGEVVTFQLAFTMPTGTTLDGSLGDNAIVRDILPDGLDYQAGSATIQSTAADGTVLSGSSYGNIATAETAIVPAIVGDELRFDLGDITNTGDGTEQLVIRFDAVVENIAGNTLGTVRTNRGRLSYEDSSGSSVDIDDTQTVLVLEPQFTSFSKTATPNTGQAGQVIDFDVVMQASGAANTATAFDVLLTDQLPADMSLDEGSVSAVFAPAACSVISANNSDGFNRLVEVVFDSIPPGCEVTISYQAELLVSVAPGDLLTNQADLVWTSVPGLNGTASATPGSTGSADGERNGSGGVNDYAASASDDVEVEPGELVKAVVDTSSTFTDVAEERASIDDLAIGETATFHITATIPFGTTSSVVINDTLPYTNGVMAYQSAQLISIGSNLNVSNNPPIITVSDSLLGDGIDDSVAFDFGQIINDPNSYGGDPADTRVVVEVVAVVVDLPANASGDALTNTALLSFGPGLDASASAEVDVVEPFLTLDKSGDITTGQGGDIVTYTLTLNHTGASNADAHDVVLEDLLPVGLSLVGGSLSQTSGPAADTLTELANGIRAEWNVFGLADTAVLEFQAEITIDAVVGSDVTNTSGVDWTSMPGTPAEERSRSTDSSHSVRISDPGLTKTVTSTDVPGTSSDQFGAGLVDLTIGEEVTYTLTVDLPKGTSESVQVIDTLPTGTVAMEIVSAALVNVGANIGGAPGVLPAAPDVTTATEVTWNLGDLSNDPAGPAGAGDLLTFEVVAVVLDNPLNQSGVVNQVNTAELNTNITDPVTATASVDIVEPELEVLKQLVTPADGFVEGDELVDYRLTVRHTVGSTAPGYRLLLTDTLPADIAWEGDGTVSSTCPGFGFDSSGDPLITFSISEFNLDDGPLSDGVCTIDFQGRTAVSVQPNRVLTNAVTLDYESLPNDDNGQSRAGTSSDTAAVTVNAPGLLKEVFSTGFADTGMGEYDPTLMDLTIGEEVTYRITVTLPEGVTSDALVVDRLPLDGTNTQLEAIGASVFSVGASLSTSLTGTPVLSDASGDGLDDTVSFDFGQVTNAPNGSLDAGDRLVLQVQARLVDTASNVASGVLLKESEFTFDGGATTATASVEVVEPQLAISKSMALVGSGSGRVTINIEVNNSGNAPAFDLDVTDVLDTTIWDISSLSIDSVSAGFEVVQEAGPGANEQTLRLRSIGAAAIPAAASVGAQVSLGFVALPPAVNPVPNTADLNSACSFAGTCIGGPGREQDPDTDSATIPVPNLVVTKVDSLLVDADSSSDVSPGDSLRYTLVMESTGAVSVSNLLLTDTPDSNTTLVAGSVTTTQGTVLEGNSVGNTVVRVDVGSLAPSATATITFDVAIVNPAPAGLEEVANQALVTSTELPPTPSDDPDPPGGDDPTVTPVNAAPDLEILKDDGGATAIPGGSVAYTLDYTNVGNQNATGVEITDIVPTDTRFDAAGSDPAWVCLPDASAGSSCTLAVGNLNVGDSGSVVFAVVLDNPLPNGVTSVLNTASIADDGSNGVDPTPGNNSDSDTTPVNVNPALGIDKSLLSANPDPVEVGSTLTYAIVVSNTGNMDLTGVTVIDSLVTPIPPAACVWDSLAGVLAIGESVRCEVEYVTTVADVNNGEVVNTATADSDQTPPVDDTVTVAIANTPAIQLVKSVTGGAPFANVGDVINYELVATNTGTARLLNVLVVDNGAVISSCAPSQPATLELTESITCQASYTVTQDDINNSSYTNDASVTGEDAVGTPVSDIDAVTVGGPGAGPSMTLVKEADTAGPVDVGDVIGYTLTTSNTGNVTLFDVLVTDDLIALSCLPGNPVDLSPGERITCTGDYTVTAADVDAQQPIFNTAQATGTDPDNNPITRTDSTNTPVQTPELTLTVAESFCSDDAPYLRWEGQAIGSGTPALTIRFIASDGSGDVLEEFTNQPLTGELLWPGAAVDGAGNGIGWPGWEQDADGNWFEVPTRLRPEVELEFQLNPTVSRTVSYPINVAASGGAPACLTEPPLPRIDLVKDATPVDANNNGVLEPGETIEYRLVGTNVGNVTLVDVEIVDDMITLSCTPSQPLTLEVGEQVVCTGQYTVQASDVGRVIINEATVEGVSLVGYPVIDDDNTNTPAGPPPVIPVAGPKGLALLMLLMLMMGLVASRTRL